MAEPAIVAESLTYRYGNLLAVDHISFTVERGEILGFLGPNGAGKSTTVKILTGQLRPMSGRAILLGIDVARCPKQVHSRIGVCFEQPNLYEELSGVDNLHLFARLFNIRDVDIAGLLQRVGLDGRGNDLVGHYSKGMKQRLMIAHALVNRPDILFLDEPTEGLDPTSAEAIRRVICEEQERGATVFLTTYGRVRNDRYAGSWIGGNPSSPVLEEEGFRDEVRIARRAIPPHAIEQITVQTRFHPLRSIRGPVACVPR